MVDELVCHGGCIVRKIYCTKAPYINNKNAIYVVGIIRYDQQKISEELTI